MAKVRELVTKASESEVDAYVASFKHHPLSQVVKNLRRIILSISNEIGDEIKGNAPTIRCAATPERGSATGVGKNVHNLPYSGRCFGVARRSRMKYC
jgi:hypothetical protein